MVTGGEIRDYSRLLDFWVTQREWQNFMGWLIRGKKRPLCLDQQHSESLPASQNRFFSHVVGPEKSECWLHDTHPVRKVLMFCHLSQLGNTQIQHYLIKQFKMECPLSMLPSTKQLTGDSQSLNSSFFSVKQCDLPSLFLSLFFPQIFFMHLLSMKHCDIYRLIFFWLQILFLFRY